MDIAGVDIIVDAVVGKSLRKQEGCNSYIFQRVKQRVRKEVADLVMQGFSQLDIILLQKKHLQAVFSSEKMLYETISKRLLRKGTQDGYIPNKLEGKETEQIEDDEEKPQETIKEFKYSKNGDLVVKLDEKKPEKQTTSKQYFDYLAEYKNDADVYDRVKGLELRGQEFPISNDGSCPRCSYKSNVFVVLDSLFPAGEMPEILHYLLTLGKAVLWSSKENMYYKDPPIFLCQGKCPADIGKCGFNINWKTTDLDKIFLFPHENYKEKPELKVDAAETLTAMKVDILNSDELTTERTSEGFPDDDKNASYETDMDTDNTEDEYDEGDVDIEYYKKNVSWVVLDQVITSNIEDTKSIDEEAIIRNMLALEEARIDYINGEMKKKICVEEETEEEEEEYMKESCDINEMSSDNNEMSIISVKGKRVSVNSILNDINNKLLKSKFEDMERISFSLKSSISRFDFTPKPPNVFTNAGSAAYAIANRDNCKISNSNNQPKIEEKEKTLNTPTPTHILKGATYYNDTTKEVKTSKPAFTSHDFPISKDGVCPYCHSSDVVYIILQEDGDVDELPELLERLYKEGKAVKRKKGEYDLPSFQCKGCTYGFNLDWKSTNLKKIFPKNAVENPLSVPPPPPNTNQNNSVSMSVHNVNTSMHYAGYTNMSNQYMYNSYSPQQYTQPPTATNPYLMNAYGYVPPVSPVVAPVAISYQSAYQGMSRMVGPYTNYLRTQLARNNTQSHAVDYSMPPPGLHQQSFRERFPPPLMNTEYTLPSQPPTSISPFIMKLAKILAKNTCQGITPGSNENTHIMENLETNKSNDPIGKVESDAVDMDLDQDDVSALYPVVSSVTSKAESNSTESSAGKTDDKMNVETESDSASDLYDPFADLCNDQSTNEDDSEELSRKSEDNSEKGSDGSCEVPSPPEVTESSPKNEENSTLPSNVSIAEIIEDEQDDIQNCHDSSNSEKNVNINNETDISITEHTINSDAVTPEPPKITSVRGRRTSSRKTRKSRNSNMTDSPIINSIVNCIENSKNSDTSIINTNTPVINSDTPIINSDIPIINTDTPTIDTDTPTIDTDTPTIDTDTPIINTDTPIINTDTPIINTDTPIINTDTPIINTDTPIINTNAPIINTDAPIINTDAPIINTDTPTINTNAPIINTDTPIINTGTPIINTDTSTIDTDTPTIDTDTPGINTDAPIINTDAPIINTDAPIINTDVTIINTDVPIIISIDDSITNGNTKDVKDNKDDIDMSSNDNPASSKLQEVIAESGEDESDTDLAEVKSTQNDTLPQKGTKRKAAVRGKRGRRARGKKRK